MNYILLLYNNLDIFKEDNFARKQKIEKIFLIIFFSVISKNFQILFLRTKLNANYIDVRKETKGKKNKFNFDVLHD